MIDTFFRTTPVTHVFKKTSLAVFLTAVFYSAISALPALARDASSPKAALEEVVVTAQRRSQNLQEVPGAVSALSADQLQRIQASDIGDIQNSIPNLTLHEGDANNAVVYLRGIGQIDSLAFADPGVGVYVDDVYLGRAQGAFLSVFDVERIEVLRGPQGTLYGRNTIGGAVKYVSKPPSETLEAKISTTAGNFDRRDVKGSLSGSLIDNQLLGRFSVASLQRDGYSDNSVDGSDDGDKNTLAWRGSLRFLPHEDWTIDLSIDSTDDSPDSSRTPARATPVFGVPANEDPFRISADFNDQSDLEVSGESLSVSWQATENLEIKSITALRRLNYDTRLDLDATELPIFGIFLEQEQEQLSQELQLNYQATGFNAVAGLYYFHEEDETESGVFGPTIEFISNSLNDQTNDSYAVYGQLDAYLTDRITLIAGLRYTVENKEFSRDQESFEPDTPFQPQLGQGRVETDVDEDDEWNNLSPKLALQYQFNEDVQFYGSISRGFKSGGFDGRSNSDFEASPYDPETLTAYEAGMKSDWLENRLRINTALFYNDYKDMQLSSFTADDNGAFAALFTNAGEAHIAGLELELTALIAEPLTVDFNLGYTDAKYDEFIGAGGIDVSSERELVNTPKWTSRLAGQYRWVTAGDHELLFDAGISYRSKTYPTVSSSEALAQDGYQLIDASITFTTSDQHWRINAGIKNLEDKEYVTHGFDLSDSLGYQLAYYGAPRTYSVSVNYHYF